VRQIQILLQFLLPPRICLQRAPSSSTSSKASRNVSPTFGDTHAHDAKWSTTFLNRELLFVKDLPGWCRNHGKGGVNAHDTIRPAIRERFRHNVKISMMQPRNWERLCIFAILMHKIQVLYTLSV